MTAPPQRILIALMKLCGVRQIEAANELDVPRSRLSSWLSGYTAMPDAAVIKLHRHINSRLTGSLPARSEEIEKRTE